LNKLDLAEILRDAAYNPHRLEEYLEKIEEIDPDKLKKYEEMTGIALARAYVDFSSIHESNFVAEEKRLMPEYIEKYFEARANEAMGGQIDISKLERDLEDLEGTKEEKIRNAENLIIVRSGPVNHIASFFVLPPGDLPEFSAFVESEEEKKKSERAAMRIVMQYERKERKWEPDDVSKFKLGFDIRSLSPPDTKSGYREIRRVR